MRQGKEQGQEQGQEQEQTQKQGQGQGQDARVVCMGGSHSGLDPIPNAFFTYPEPKSNSSTNITPTLQMSFFMSISTNPSHYITPTLHLSFSVSTSTLPSPNITPTLQPKEEIEKEEAKKEPLPKSKVPPCGLGLCKPVCVQCGHGYACNVVTAMRAV